MTPHRPSRKMLVGAALVALLAPLAFVAALQTSAQAAVGPRPHHLKMYKVEKHFDLSGEFPDNSLHEHLYCQNGDYVLDGMWRIDHVDQANPDLDMFGDERDVRVDASYGDNADPTEWHFRLFNGADGNAQVKLFITCLDNDTEGQHGHSHAIQLSNRHDDGSHSAMPAGNAEFDHATTCQADELAVAPGFNFTAGSGRIFRSWPTVDYRSWHWAFVVPSTSDVTLYHRCLKTKTAPAGNGPHAHNIYADWFPGYGGNHYTVPNNNHGWVIEDSCNHKFYDKGMVAGFWIDDPHHTWWLGMDPRPKTRAFRFWKDGAGSGSVYTTLLCIGSRTGKQVSP